MRRLACSSHWYALPDGLRTEINETYRRDSRRHLQLYREAIRLLAQIPVTEGHRS